MDKINLIKEALREWQGGKLEPEQDNVPLMAH